jgi:hypothetical protein
MGCPMHVWVPLMAAAAPFARVARDKVRALASQPPKVETPREVHRWAPVGSAQATEVDSTTR